MLSALVNVMLPVFLIAGIGFVLARIFTIDQLSLNKVQLYALTPALAFSSIMQTTVSPTNIGHLAVGYAASILTLGLVGALASRLVPKLNRRGVMASAMLGNNGNFGLPIALLALGQAGLDQAIVIFMFAIVVLWTVGPALFGRVPTVKAVLGDIARLPVIWTMAAAITFRLLRVELPEPVTVAVDMVGQASIPMILIALGIQLGYSKKVLVNLPVIISVAIKLVIAPLIGLGVCLLVGLRGLELQSMVLALSMPTAVNVFLLALDYDSDAETVAGTVAASTLLSLFTISIVVANLSALG